MAENLPATFGFQDISFGYGGNAVLHIDHLQLPPTGLIFIVGPSGVGKSTFLESIGLMSNAFMPFQPSTSTFHIRGESIDPHTLWLHSGQRITSIRESTFSFIFQSTNLMPNFSILENILIAAQFAPEAYTKTVEQVHALAADMHLPKGILDRYPFEISGGQKQRVAFVRALVGEFSILLADEPTGNLDQENSLALFEILKKHITQLQKSAIIVTHHLELAREYGDMIIEFVSEPNGPAKPIIIAASTGSLKHGASK